MSYTILWLRRMRSPQLLGLWSLTRGLTLMYVSLLVFFSSRRRHTRFDCDWSSDVCSSDLWTRLVVWLAVTSPRPSRTPPASTTARVPNRSDSAPQRKPPRPMQSQLMSAAVEIPVRDQPIASAIGARNTVSETIAPKPTQVTTIPTPTIVQP